MTKIFKKIKLSLLLAVAGFTAMSAASGMKPLNADDAETLQYVALGDSRATGFGFADYKDVNDGFLSVTAGSYTKSIVLDFQTRQQKIEFTNLAANSFRMEDIYFELGGTDFDSFYATDEYYKDVFDATTEGGKKLNEVYAKALPGGSSLTGEDANAAVKGAFRRAVLNADLITLDAGINGIVDFLLGKIGSFIKTGGDEISEIAEILPEVEVGGEDTAQGLLDRMGYEDISLQDIYDCVFGFIECKTGWDLAHLHNVDIGFAKLDVNYLCEMVVFSLVSYCNYLNETTKLIYELNPDVDLVVVGLSNPFEGINVKLGDYIVPVGDFFDVLFEAVNLYGQVATKKADEYFYVDPLLLDLNRRIENLEGATTVEARTALGEDEKTILLGMVKQIVDLAEKQFKVSLGINFDYELDLYFSTADSGALTIGAARTLIVDILRGAQHNTFRGVDVEAVEELVDFVSGSLSWKGIEEQLINVKNDGIIYLASRYFLGNGALNTFDNASHDALYNAILSKLDKGMSARAYVVDKVVTKVVKLLNEFTEFVTDAPYKDWVQDNFDEANEFIRNVFGEFTTLFNSLVDGDVEKFHQDAEDLVGDVTTWLGNAVTFIKDKVDDCITWGEGVLQDYDDFMTEITGEVQDLTSLIKDIAAFIRDDIKTKVESAIYTAQNAIAEAIDFVEQKVKEATVLFGEAVDKIQELAIEAIEWLANAPTEYHEEFGEFVGYYYDVEETFLDRVATEINSVISYVEEHIVELFEEVVDVVDYFAEELKDVCGIPDAAYLALVDEVVGVIDDFVQIFLDQHGEDCDRIIDFFVNGNGSKLVSKETQAAIVAAINGVEDAITTKLTSIHNALVEFEEAGIDYIEGVVSNIKASLDNALAEIQSFITLAKTEVEDYIAPLLVDMYDSFIETAQVIFPHKFNLEDVNWSTAKADTWTDKDGVIHQKGTVACETCGWIEEVEATYTWAFPSTGATCTAKVTLPGNNTNKAETITETIKATVSEYTRPNLVTKTDGYVELEADFTKNFTTQHFDNITVKTSEIEYKWSDDLTTADAKATASTKVTYVAGGTTYEMETWTVVGKIDFEHADIDADSMTLDLTATFSDKLSEDDTKAVEAMPINTKSAYPFQFDKDSTKYVWSQDGKHCEASATYTLGGKQYTIKEVADIKDGTVVVRDNSFWAEFPHFAANKYNADVVVEQSPFVYKFNENYTACVGESIIKVNGEEFYTVTDTSVEVTQKYIEPTATDLGHVEFVAVVDGKVVLSETKDLVVSNETPIEYEWLLDGTCRATITLEDGLGNTFTYTEKAVDYVVEETITEDGKTVIKTTPVFTHSVMPESEIVSETLPYVEFRHVAGESGKIIVDGAEIQFDESAISTIDPTSQLVTDISGDSIKISLKDKQGFDDTFNGEVTIKLPFNEEVPEGYQVKVYYVNGGELVDMNGTYIANPDYNPNDPNSVRGWVEFTTTHFSEFVIRVEKIPEEEPEPVPPTPEKEGLGLWWILIGILALSCVISLVYVLVIKPRRAAKEGK